MNQQYQQSVAELARRAREAAAARELSPAQRATVEEQRAGLMHAYHRRLASRRNAAQSEAQAEPTPWQTTSGG